MASRTEARVGRAGTWIVRFVVAASFGAFGALCFGGCGNPVELDGQDLCDEVGYAIANRTFQCENDPELGNQRFEDLRRDYRCQEEMAVAESRDGSICPVNALGCEEVKENGQSLEWWLGVSGCSRWFTHADGTPVPEYLDGGLPPPTCTGTSVLCGETCVDIENDAVNCGGCDVRCPDGLLCVARECVFR